MSKSVEQIFEEWSGTIAKNADQAKDIDAIYQFNVTGEEEGQYVIDCTTATVKSGADEGAQCVITIDSDDFKGMVDGSINGQQLFMMGKLQIEGDFQLALRLQEVFEAAAG